MFVVKSSFVWCQLNSAKTPRIAVGQSVSTVPEKRCCDVIVFTSPVSRSRSRIVSPTVSRISARLPPLWRWIMIAVTTRFMSSESARSSIE